MTTRKFKLHTKSGTRMDIECEQFYGIDGELRFFYVRGIDSILHYTVAKDTWLSLVEYRTEADDAARG